MLIIQFLSVIKILSIIFSITGIETAFPANLYSPESLILGYLYDFGKP
jgi:hypothetical protein